MEQKDFYVKRKDKMVRQFRKLIARNVAVLDGAFVEHEVESIIAQALDEYTLLIPTLPSIGGRKNALTRNLVGSAQLLALIRVLEKRGMGDYEIGKMLYDIYVSHLASMPGLATRVLGTIYLTRFWQRRMSKRAARSQERRYPDDWVFEFVPGDSSTFTFGINHLECGICKYYKRMGAEKYIPYLCLLDYPLFAMLGVCLERTETLGNGAMRCDFRFSRRKPVAGGWPPDSVKEFRGGGKRT